MKRSTVQNPRAEELLVERAFRPLGDNEHRELHDLGAEDDDSFDIAAAAIALATMRIEPMPQHLANKILAASPANLTRTLPGVIVPIEIPRDTLVGVDIALLAPEPPPQPPAETRPSAPIIPLPVRRTEAAPRRRTSVAPWLLAAACLIVACGAVWRLIGQTSTPVVATTPSPATSRAALIASATDLSTIAWTPTQDPAAHGATGDVVWSQTQQRGFMRFVGLTPNDPTQFQYQLWIFDKTRDQAFPVDGGVFDVSTGEVIIPISAKLRVADATLFAVTVEKPGGVVVSKRERIVVTAARG